MSDSILLDGREVQVTVADLVLHVDDDEFRGNIDCVITFSEPVSSEDTLRSLRLAITSRNTRELLDISGYLETSCGLECTLYWSMLSEHDLSETDIPDEMFHVHARKRIWDDWQFFLERSPIYYVEQARTPILILHGKEDTRVHPSQSMELYRNLKILDKVPVRLIFYPGEGHGNRKAAARYDYNLRMLRWMEHYLTGPGGDAPPVDIEHAPAKAEDSEE